MTFSKTLALTAMATLIGIGTVAAQSGPVATACKDDIAKFCAGQPHDGSVRACLTAAKDKVSPECKTALETTGGGQGRGKGKGMN